MTVTAVRKDPQALTMTLEAEFDASAERTPNTDMPINEARVTIEAIGDGRTRMAVESLFPSAEAMEQVLAMGMEEGLTLAVGQIDALLSEDAIAQR